VFIKLSSPILLRIGKDISQEDLVSDPELMSAVLQGKVKVQGGVLPQSKLRKRIKKHGLLSNSAQVIGSGLGSGLGWHFGEKLKMFKKMPAVGGSMLAVPAGILASNLIKGITED